MQATVAVPGGHAETDRMLVTVGSSILTWTWIRQRGGYKWPKVLRKLFSGALKCLQHC